MKTLYEVHWHYNDDTLVRISVSPIKVLREGILPGCSAVSITAVDKDGHQFQGCPQNYFETEETAWKQATIELQETIASKERDVCEAQRRIEGLRNVLLAIQEAEPIKVPVDTISVVGMPEFDALLDHIYEEGTSSEGAVHLANKLVREALRQQLAERDAEILEQCRLNGMGAERELKLIAQRNKLAGLLRKVLATHDYHTDDGEHAADEAYAALAEVK